MITYAYDVLIKKCAVHIDNSLFSNENMLTTLTGEIHVDAGMFADTAQHLMQDIGTFFPVCDVRSMEAGKKEFG